MGNHIATNSDSGVGTARELVSSQRTRSRGNAATDRRPELVFGLVAALGTSLSPLVDELRSALGSVGYGSTAIRVSDLISEVYAGAPNARQLGETRMAALMHEGDELRKTAGAAAAVTLGILRVRQERRGKGEREAHATILRSIKRKEEVALLRKVYGPRFLLIGGWATREDRAAAIERRLHIEYPCRKVGWYARQVAELMHRDEDDADHPLGQGVRDAFELADVYAATHRGHPISPHTARLVRLLFGAPFETPTRAEEAMYLARGAALRSSAAGRQVGAVVIDEDGEVLVTGTNEAPRASGGQYWAEETPDHRDFTYGHDVNDRLKMEIVADVLARLKQAKWLTGAPDMPDLNKLTTKALNGPLRGSRIGDLLEFGRIAHAEMAAICTAARRGTSLRGATMYSTTYPCHECARLIIAAGIKKVVYIDPYPKSQVQEMFHDEVSEGSEIRRGSVAFEPFDGIAPRLFQKVFEMSSRNRNKITGEYITWNPQNSQPRLPADTVSPLIMEAKITKDLQDELKAHNWKPFKASQRNRPR
jgi:deoxycytidylate deaminase